MALSVEISSSPPVEENIVTSSEWERIIGRLLLKKNIVLSPHPTLPEIITFRDRETDVITAPFTDGNLAGIYGFFNTVHNNWVHDSAYKSRLSSHLTEESGVETVSLLPFTKRSVRWLKQSLKDQKPQTIERPLDVAETVEQSLTEYFEQLFDGKDITLKTIDLRHRGIQLENEWRPVTSNLYVFTRKGQDDTGIVGVDIYGYAPNGGVTPMQTYPDMKLGVYQHVGGFVVVPDEASLQERKDISRYAVNTLKSITHRPDMTVITVDSALLNKWQHIGQPWPTEQDIATFLEKPAKKRVDYGGILRGFDQRVFLKIYEPEHSHIGGTQLKVIIQVAPDVFYSIMLDKGYIFDMVPAWSGKGSGPSYIDGLMPFLKEGVFGTNWDDLRVMRSDLLLQSLNSQVLMTGYQQALFEFDFKDIPKELFVLLECYHRFGELTVDQYLREKIPVFYNSLRHDNQIGKIYATLNKLEKQLYQKKIIHLTLAITHAHQDHAIGSSIVRDSIMRTWTAETYALLSNDHEISGEWYIQDTAVRKMRERPELMHGSSYAVFAYPHHLIAPGETIEIGPNIFITAIPVSHMLGAVGFLVEVRDSKQRLVNSIAYPGDYKDTSFFDEVGKRGGTDLLLIEGTNPPHVKKDSVAFTESIVADNFERILQRASEDESNSLVIVDLIKNAFERYNNFVALAKQYQRTPVISTRMAHAIDLLHKHLNIHGSVNSHIPTLERSGIKIWKKPASKYDPYEQELFTAFGEVTQDDLSASPEKYVLFRDNSESPYKLDGIQAEKVYWIQSTYAAYDETARKEKRYKRDFATQRNGWFFLDKGFHATGHVALYEPEHPDADQGILANIYRAKPKELVVVHTKKRGTLSKVVKKYPQNGDIYVHDSLSHPSHVIHLKSRI